LRAFFNEERVAFHDRLTKADTLPGLADCIDNLLGSLQDRFLNALPVAKARFARRCFNWIGISSAVLNASVISSCALHEGVRPAGATSSILWSRLVSTLVQAVVAFLALMAIIHFSLTGTVFLCVLLFFLALEIIGIGVSFWRGGKTSPLLWALLGLPAPRAQEQAEEPLQFRTSVQADATKICEALMEAFEAIDRAIAEHEGNDSKEEETSLTDCPHALDLLQKLVSAATQGNATHALNLASDARAVLLAYKIKAHVFDPAKNSDWFDAEPAVTSNIRIHTTDLVALTNGDNILRRGRVIEPYKSEA